jgi:hypothetical protein
MMMHRGKYIIVLFYLHFSTIKSIANVYIHKCHFELYAAIIELSVLYSYSSLQLLHLPFVVEYYEPKRWIQ